MDAQTAAELQVVLEGVDLPASKQALVEYAHSQDEQAARSLVALPEREYRSRKFPVLLKLLSRAMPDISC